MHYLSNSYNQLQADIGSAATLKCPEKIYLDMTEDCNLRCPMCRENVEMLGKTMPMELFKQMVDETSPYCKSYSLFIWGEPLVLPDFRERVDYAVSKKRQDCIIEISTNGVLLSDAMIMFLRSRNVRVIVSFDGADKAVFERIRAGASFDRVCQNALALNRAYEDTVLDIAPASYTAVQKDNQSELGKIVRKVSALGFRRIGFGLVTGPAEYAPDFDEKLCRDLEEAYSIAGREELFLELYPTKVGDYVYWGGRYVPDDNFVVSTRCDAPLRSAVIRYDGEVCLCCNFGAAAGNVKGRTFSEIWTSPQYDKLREAINDMENMPDICRRCWWVNR